MYETCLSPMQVTYTDGDNEEVLLSNERIKFFVSLEEMNRLKLTPSDTCPETHGIDIDELIVLAADAGSEDCECHEPGDILWAKLTGKLWRSFSTSDNFAAFDNFCSTCDFITFTLLNISQ